MNVQDLPRQYRPADHEGRIFQKWLDADAFHADPDRVISGQARPFCVLIPPPNVTAALHLGHALNNTLQDVLVRAHRMMGCETLWMPGTDHAGIATQTIVEKRLLQTEGRRRTDFTREEFVARVQAFKDEYEARITDQLKRIGCSCDWRRQRFTMDKVCARAVREAFFRLFKDGLIYRGKRLVNWDPVTQTALADDEVEMEEVQGHFWYLRYPLVHQPTNKADPMDAQEVTWSELAARGYPGAEDMPEDDEAWITVATTRPETYLGDTAVAVNPHDPRAKPLRGLYVQLPLVGRIIPIIEDDYVVTPDPESNDPKARFATGFLKVTPAHDPNDWEIGQRHGLEIINVMAPDASISDRHGWDREGRKEGGHVFVGKSREEARDLVVREFRDRNLLEAVKPHTHSIGHSYRTNVPIEPYLSDQWYVKVTDDRLVGAAQRALHENLLHFYPDRYARTYEQWHANLRDWCISRQLWWGHRIPVWSNAHAPGQALDDLLEQPAYTAEGSALGTFERIEEMGRIATSQLPGDDGPIFVCVRDAGDVDVINALESVGFRQDPDVLDTWFSSALWPISTMGWPDPQLASKETNILDFPQLLPAFTPTSTLCTAREIITLWVSRMVMFTRYFLAELDGTRPGRARVPFRDVFIHPVIQDGEGQKMSKSLGNGIDPLDIVESHGADALRLSMCQLATSTQDVRVPLDPVCPHCAHTFEARKIRTPSGHVVHAPEQTCPACRQKMVTPYGLFSGSAKATDAAPLCRLTSPRFDASRNFCNKLWNAARFAISILEGKGVEPVLSPASLSLADRWMLARLHDAAQEATRAIQTYQFSHYAQVVYDLLWRDFCDWYIEAIKPTAPDDPRQRTVLRASLDAILRLLHPVLPFITEAIYERLSDLPGAQIVGLDLAPPRKGDTICTAGWPTLDPGIRDPDAITRFDRLKEIVTAVREVRAQQNVKPKQRVTLHVSPALAAEIAEAGGIVETLAVVASVTTEPPSSRAAVCTMLGEAAHVSHLADAIDPEAERAAAARLIADLDRRIASHRNRLNNKGYIDKAPPHIVQQTRDELARMESERDAAIAVLQGST